MSSGVKRGDGWLVLAAAAGLTIALLLASGAGRAPPTSCPARAHPDPARAMRIVRRLGSVAEGRARLRRAPSPLRLCFAAGEGVVQANGVLVLPSEGGDGESAARLGHLLLHQGEPATFSAVHAATEPCATVVARAIEAEARAHALELELRGALGVASAMHRFPFEAAYWASPAALRPDVVRAYLLGEGAANLGLAAAYAQSCRAQQARAQQEQRP